jgi:hydrogenase maturation protease
MAVPAVAQHAIVLGVGNLLQSDEGVGPQAIDRIGRDYRLPPQVSLIDGGTSAMELLDDLAHAGLLLIIDAVAHGAEPGSIRILEGDEVPRFFTLKLSPHQVGLSDVLATLQLSDESPRETVIIGVEPASLALGMELSAPVSHAMPRLIDEVLQRLRAAGLPAQPIEAAAGCAS